MRLLWSPLVLVLAASLIVAAGPTGCGRDDSTVIAADCSMCGEELQSQCIDTYSECIQGGDDSTSCQGVINALCMPDGGGDAGDGGGSDASDGANDAPDGDARDASGA